MQSQRQTEIYARRSSQGVRASPLARTQETRLALPLGLAFTHQLSKYYCHYALALLYEYQSMYRYLGYTAYVQQVESRSASV